MTRIRSGFCRVGVRTGSSVYSRRPPAAGRRMPRRPVPTMRDGDAPEVTGGREISPPGASFGLRPSARDTNPPSASIPVQRLTKNSGPSTASAAVRRAPSGDASADRRSSRASSSPHTRKQTSIVARTLPAGDQATFRLAGRRGRESDAGSGLDHQNRK